MDQKPNKLLSRVNRVVGQAEGIRKMIQEGRYCVEILHQIAAVRSALDSLGLELLTRHIEGCVMGHDHGEGHAHAKTMSKEELLAEIQTVLSNFLK